MSSVNRHTHHRSHKLWCGRDHLMEKLKRLQNKMQLHTFISNVCLFQLFKKISIRDFSIYNQIFNNIKLNSVESALYKCFNKIRSNFGVRLNRIWKYEKNS